MVEFDTLEDIRHWLHRRSKEEAVVLAARCALRVVPALGAGSALEPRRVREDVILRAFRAVATSWVVVRYPSHWEAAAIAAAWDDASSAIVPVIYAAGTAYTAAEAAAQAYAASPDAQATATKVVEYSIDAAVSAANAYGGDAVATRTDATRAVAADAALLESGAYALELAGQPLWRGEVPVWSGHLWAELRNGLQSAGDEHWNVWTSWYEARLRGDRINWDLELARVTEVAKGEWEAGPAAANAKIEAIQARFASMRANDDPNGRSVDPGQLLAAQAPSAYGYTIRDGRIAAVPWPSKRPDPDDQVTSDLHAALKALIASALERLAPLAPGGRADNSYESDDVAEALRSLDRALGATVSDLREGLALASLAELQALDEVLALPPASLSVPVWLAAKLRALRTATSELVARYPEAAAMRARTLARELQAADLNAVETAHRDLREAAQAHGDVVEPGAVEALSGFEGYLRHLRNLRPQDEAAKSRVIERTGEILAAQSIGDQNFLQAVKSYSRSMTRSVTQYAQDAGARARKGSLDGIEESAKVATKSAILVLIVKLLGPVAAAALVIPAMRQEQRELETERDELEAVGGRKKKPKR